MNHNHSIRDSYYTNQHHIYNTFISSSLTLFSCLLQIGYKFFSGASCLSVWTHTTSSRAAARTRARSIAASVPPRADKFAVVISAGIQGAKIKTCASRSTATHCSFQRVSRYSGSTDQQGPGNGLERQRKERQRGIGSSEVRSWSSPRPRPCVNMVREYCLSQIYQYWHRHCLYQTLEMCENYTFEQLVCHCTHGAAQISIRHWHGDRSRYSVSTGKNIFLVS